MTEPPMREPTFFVLAALLRGPCTVRAEAVRMAEAARLGIGPARATKTGPLAWKLRTT